MNRLHKFVAMLLGMLVLSAGMGSAFAIGADDGTNAVTTLLGVVNHAADQTFPVVLGILAALIGLGVMLKFGRKAGARA